MTSPPPSTNGQFASDWLISTAWPLWLRHGVEWENGGFAESLHPQDLSSPSRFRRLRVAARQVYVFAQAAEAGVPRAEAAVRLGLSFLRRHARQPDGGYAWRFELDNTPTDQTRDLYDHAFVLLALAHAGRATVDTELTREAGALVDYLEQHFRHPAGGFRESIPDALPRRQNPHMHLLEALLAAHAAFGETRYLDLADEIVDLLIDRMMQPVGMEPGEGALAEFFDADFHPVRDADGWFVVEPGHHFEWVWLLDTYLRQAKAAGRRVRGGDVDRVTGQLMRHAEAFGIDPDSGLVLDAIPREDGTRSRSFRIWPQTERLRAAIRRPDLARTDAAQCLTLLRRYLDGAQAGLWRERLSSEGQELEQPAPASSLYHLTGALLEAALKTAW